MAKMSHIMIGFCLTMCGGSLVQGSPGPLKFSNAPLFVSKNPRSFVQMVTDRAKKAGVAFSFAPVRDHSKTRTAQYVPDENKLWKDARGDTANRIADHLERLENNYGPLLIHEIRVKMVGGDDRDTRVVVVNWSPKGTF